MNLKNAVLSLLAFTGNVASADEVRAVRPGIRGDRPVGSVLPDADSKETLPEGNAEEKSDLEERRIVPTSNVDLLESKDGSRDEDGASEIDLAGPEDSSLCQDMFDWCKNFQWPGIINNQNQQNQNQQGCRSVYQICSQKVADRKFDARFDGACLDSKGRGYPNLQFFNLSPDQCKARCNAILRVKVQGVGVGKANSGARGYCTCYLDRKNFRGCQEFASLGKNTRCYWANDREYVFGKHGAHEGTGPATHGTGVVSNPNYYCFADSSDASSSSSTLDDSPRDDLGLAHRVE